MYGCGFKRQSVFRSYILLDGYGSSFAKKFVLGLFGDATEGIPSQLVNASRGLLRILYGSIYPSEQNGCAVLWKSSAETGASVGRVGGVRVRLFFSMACLHHSSLRILKGGKLL